MEDRGVDLAALGCLQKFVSQTRSLQHAFGLHWGRTDSHAGGNISFTVHPMLCSSEDKYGPLQLLWSRRALLLILRWDDVGEKTLALHSHP